MKNPQVGRPVSASPSAVATPTRMLVKPPGPAQQQTPFRSATDTDVPASCIRAFREGNSETLWLRPTPTTTRLVQARSPSTSARWRGF